VRYAHAARELSTAEQYLGVQHRLLNQIRSSSAAEATSQQTLIREEMNSLVAEVKRDLAYANLQNAYANVYASIGLDAFPPFALDQVSVAELTNHLRKTWVGGGALMQARLVGGSRDAVGSIVRADGKSDAGKSQAAALESGAGAHAQTETAEFAGKPAQERGAAMGDAPKVEADAMAAATGETTQGPTRD
jgi:hypothetical protein